MRPGSGATSITSYRWSFGDGSTSTDVSPTHTFTQQGTFNVTLTVTNDRGVAASTTKAISVAAGAVPTAAFTFGPTPVNVNDVVNFDASGSKPGNGHTIASYQWNFGDGTTKSGITTTHDFVSAGTFTVTLIVTDEAGQKATATQTVAVGSGAPTAVLIVNKTGGNSVVADGNGSTATGASTIQTYTFIWGDGQTTSGNSASVSHTYAAAGTYTVRLVVADDINRTGSATTSVTVP